MDGRPLTLYDMCVASCAKGVMTFECGTCARNTEREEQSCITSVPNVLVVQVIRTQIDHQGRLLHVHVSVWERLTLERHQMFESEPLDFWKVQKSTVNTSDSSKIFIS